MIKDKYKNKEKSYYRNVRKDILELIPEFNKGGDILEVGSGNGATLRYLKEIGYAKYVCGIDLMGLEGQEEIDDFYVMNIEEERFNYKKKFDVILFLDVLEHLRNPKEILKQFRELLKDRGVIIISLPNIREFNTLKDIVINGDFKYVKSGILDETHLRFFCKKNHLELLEESGFEIKRIQSNLGRKRRLFNVLTFKIFEEFLSIQYISVNEKKIEIKL